MVVVAGFTVRDEPVTVPMPLSIEMLVALLTLQLSVEDCPAVMVDGEALKLEIVGAGVGAATVVVVDAVTEPALLLAVRT